MRKNEEEVHSHRAAMPKNTEIEFVAHIPAGIIIHSRHLEFTYSYHSCHVPYFVLHLNHA